MAGHVIVLQALAGWRARELRSAPVARLALVPVPVPVAAPVRPSTAVTATDIRPEVGSGRPSHAAPPRTTTGAAAGAARPEGGDAKLDRPGLGQLATGRGATPEVASSPAADPTAASTAAETGPVDAGETGTTAPSYLAELPDAFTMRLAVRRGEQSGNGHLHLERAADGSYRLRLELRLPRGPLLEMTSAGLSGATGLVPDRFTDRRLARGLAAANFDRAARRVRFSARTDAMPIAASAQDRLSWLVQLAAVVRRDPALRRAGAAVLLQVVGARGGTQLWRFECLGPDEPFASGNTQRHALLRLVREPELAYDNRVEVWLDPERQHLPVRVRYTLVPTQQHLEFWLSDASVAD